jgi:hypothetical protein
MSSEQAKVIIGAYATGAVGKGGKPRFIPLLGSLLQAALDQEQFLVTLQLGGMDGRNGDPFYKMTEIHKGNLKHWLPIVIEPVPTNFEKLVETYQEHQSRRQMPCASLLNQLINYDASNQVSQDSCAFCHFNDQSTDPSCHDMASWQKTEIGSMECDRLSTKDSLFAKCFTQSTFECGTIQQAIQKISKFDGDSHVMVLQIDVEGFETQVLEGYFNETTHRPPVVNFENKVLRGRGQLDKLHTFLKNQGYTIHEKRIDTLALLGYQGEDTSVFSK